MKTNQNLTLAALAARAVRLLASTQITLVGVFALLALPAHADTFGSGANAFTIDFVDIGNPGNGDDFGEGGGSYSSPYGGVAYIYRIGVTEVPQEWITKATNLGMTNVAAGAWTGRQPAANTTWYEAAAFVNWLNTSTGHQPAYDLTYSGGWSMNLWSSEQAWQAGGENLYRHKDAYYFLPSEDEWYKAAWHKNDGVTANYWDYATGSNMIPTPVASGTGAGTVVYNNLTSSPATVDNNGGLSPYGTRGQNGNVVEMLESAATAPNDSPSENRARRGGNYVLGADILHPAGRGVYSPSGASFDFIGFRVASSAPIAAVVPGQSYLSPGGGLTLSLTNTFNVPSSYQWQFNDTNIPGAIGPTLALSNVTTNDSGLYRVTISNAFEVFITAPAVVQVVNQLTISSHPQNTTVLPGTSVTLSVTAVSPLPITYQWQLNGTNLADQTNAILSLSNVQFDPHTGYYRALVSDTMSNVWSDTANLVVLVRPTVTSQPVAQTVLQGGTAIFSVSATPNHSLLPLNYRWQRQGVTFLSNAPPTLVITNVQPGTAGSFRVTITNLAGGVNSASVNLTVLPDFDRDGMADAWEKLHGFDTNNLADAGLDFDGDGMSNRDEYAAGANPTNAASVLKLQIVPVAGSSAGLTFLAISNRTYSVEWNTQLTGDTWSNLVDVLAQPADRIESVSDTNAGGPMRFYRVVTPRSP